jgi:hypothetical protein
MKRMRTLKSETKSAVWERELCLRQEFQEALSSDVVHQLTMLRGRCVLRLAIATNVFKQCTTPRILFLATDIIHVPSAVLPTQLLWK